MWLICPSLHRERDLCGIQGVRAVSHYDGQATESSVGIEIIFRSTGTAVSAQGKTNSAAEHIHTVAVCSTFQLFPRCEYSWSPPVVPKVPPITPRDVFQQQWVVLSRGATVRFPSPYTCIMHIHSWMSDFRCSDILLLSQAGSQRGNPTSHRSVGVRGVIF